MRPVLVAVCLLVAACSKQDASASDGGAPPSSPADPAWKFAHPCDVLLTRSDAEKILGSTDLLEQEEPGPRSDAHCVWAVKGARGFVELRVHFPTRKADFDKPVPDRVLASGVGDRAYIQKRLSWGHVDVLKGDQTFFVQIEHGGLAAGRPPSSDEARTEILDLARVVASRI